MRRILMVLAMVATAAPAMADCEHFKWSVARERALFAGSPAALPATGASAQVGAAYDLALAQDPSLPLPAERAPEPGRRGVVVSLSVVPAGMYQITLSREGWIDVAQNGARVKSNAFSGQHDCPDVRKTVRFELGAGAAIVQISNAAEERVNFAILPAN